MKYARGCHQFWRQIIDTIFYVFIFLSFLRSVIFIRKTTIELGYNDHGYNEFTAIRNQISKNFVFQMFNVIHKASHYNESRL